MAPLRCAAKFDPFLSLDCAPPRPPPWRNPRKGRDQILPSGNTEQPAAGGDRGEVLVRVGERKVAGGVPAREEDDIIQCWSQINGSNWDLLTWGLRAQLVPVLQNVPSHLLLDRGLVNLNLECPVVCPILLGLMTFGKSG